MARPDLRLARIEAHTLADALSAQIALQRPSVDPGSHAIQWAEEDALAALKSLVKCMGYSLVADVKVVSSGDAAPVLVAAE